MSLTIGDEGMLYSSGMPVPLPPKERGILAILMIRAPAVVPKDEVIRTVWNGRHTSDESLARCVSSLRRHLPGLRIESVYGVGYRLVSTSLQSDPTVQSMTGVPSSAANAYFYASNLIEIRTERAMQVAMETLGTLLTDHPDFAPGHVLAAHAIAIALAWGRLPNDGVALARAQAHLDAAERLRKDVPGALACRAWLSAIHWKFDEAERQFREAVEKHPGDANALVQQSWHLLACDRAPEALESLKRAQRLHPFAVVPGTFMATVLSHLERWDEAIAVCRRVATIYPTPPVAKFMLLLQLNREPSPALVEQTRMGSNDPDTAALFASLHAYALSRCGQPEAARAAIDDALRWPPGRATERLFMAAPLVELGERDAAVRVIVESYESGYGYLPAFLRSPLLAPLRDVTAVAAMLSDFDRRAAAARRVR